MGLLKRFKAVWKAIRGEELIVQPYFKTLNFSLFSQEETAQDKLKHFVHWVYICITKNAAAMADVPLRLYVTTNEGDNQYKYLKKGIDTRSLDKKRIAYLAKSPLNSLAISKSISVEEVVTHPFLELWRKVNPFMNGFEMVKLIDHYLELTGDAFLYIYRNALGMPEELWVLPSQYVWVVPDKKDFIKGYLYGSSMQDAQALATDEVIHFKFTNPHAIWKGFSPVQGSISAIRRKEDMDQYEDSLLQNNARPDFLILAKKKMGEEDKRALREQWQQLYGSRIGRGRPALLDTDAEIKELGFSPKDIGYINGQKFTKEEICGAFGVPVSKVVPDAKYSNAEVGDREWKSDTIKPRLTLISDKLNEDLVGEFDSRLFCAFDNPVPEDKEFELRKQEMYLKNGVIVIDEVREHEGLEDVPWGKVPIMPFNVAPLGTPMPETMLQELSSGITSVKVLPARKQWQRPPRPKLNEMATIMRRIFRGMEEEAKRNLLERKSITKQTFEETFYFMFDEEKWAEETAEQMGKPIRSQLVIGGQYGMNQLRAGLRFDVMDPNIRQFLQQYVAHFSLTTTRQTGVDFSRTMLEGIEAGETIFELRKRVEDFFGRMKLHKSETIARAEASRSAHEGMVAGWKQSQVVKGKVWRTQSGACQFCQTMDGKYVELDKNYFEQGSVVQGAEGGNLTLNYEPVIAPPLHPNCECTVTAVLID